MTLTLPLPPRALDPRREQPGTEGREHRRHRPRHRHRRERHSRRDALLVLLLPGVIGGLLVLGLLGIPYAQGWQAHDVVTASMGTTAPVGSLVITEPVAPQRLAVGEVIVFHPPGQQHVTFVHRITALHGAGTDTLVTTRGDLSGADDPWQLTAGGIEGRAVRIVPVLGWLLRMAPWLVGGALLVALLTVGLRRESRRALRILGGVLVTVATIWHFRPLVGLELVSYGATRNGAQATAVPTGILPVHVRAVRHAAGTASADPGQLFTVHTLGAVTGRVEILARPWLHGAWWLVLLVVLTPLLVGLATDRGRDADRR